MCSLFYKRTVLGIALGFVLMALWACNEVSSNDFTAWDKIGLEEGDIVFRRGSSLASHIVLLSDTRGNYSHIGIVVSDNGHFKVVHAVPGESEPAHPDRVKIDRLEDFFAEGRAVSGRVMRLEMSDSLRSLVASRALDFYSDSIPFDHDYDLSDQSHLYCTELIWHAYKAAGIDITRNRRSHVNFFTFSGDFIFPSDISENKDLISIYSFNNH